MSEQVEIEIDGTKLQIFSKTVIHNPHSDVEFQAALTFYNGTYVNVYRVRGGKWTFLPPFAIGSASLVGHVVDPF